MLYESGIRYGSTSGSKGRINLFLEKGIPNNNHELLKFIPTALFYLKALVTKSVGDERPKHPREVEDYLASIDQQKHDLIADIRKACDKLGRERPDVTQFLERLQKIITKE